MPKEYITRLVYDRAHQSLALVSGQDNSVLGGVTYRLFKSRGFCEIVFFAMAANEQVKGYGAFLMNRLKATIAPTDNLPSPPVKYLLTYADNYAIGYFKKQGFTKEITLDREIWQGYIKDYDGGTLMQCTLVDGVDYLNIYPMLYRQKQALTVRINQRIGCDKVYPGLSGPFPLKPDQIPGILEAGWTSSMADLGEAPKHSLLYDSLRQLLSDLQSHPAAWPFRAPVDANEVPGYYDMIAEPIDLSAMETRLEEGQYRRIEDFINDITRMCENCRIFNEQSSTYYKLANQLESYCKDRLRARNLA